MLAKLYLNDGVLLNGQSLPYKTNKRAVETYQTTAATKKHW